MSTLKVDTIQTSAGATASADGLGITVTGANLYQIKQDYLQADVTVNNTTIYGSLEIAVTRQSGTSNFMILLDSIGNRASTSSQNLAGYRKQVNGGGYGSDTFKYWADETNWATRFASFFDTTTGSAGDVVTFQTAYRNTASQNDLFSYNRMIVMEFEPS